MTAFAPEQSRIVLPLIALMKTRETPSGHTIPAVAVDAAVVPASGLA